MVGFISMPRELVCPFYVHTNVGPYYSDWHTNTHLLQLEQEDVAPRLRAQRRDAQAVVERQGLFVVRRRAVVVVM